MTRHGLWCALLVGLQSAAPAVPAPVEPIGALLDAFKTYDVVGLSAGEGHGDVRGPAFVVSLIRDPRFAATSIDVVMENGNSRYQDVMDRFTSGDDVPYADLRRVWDDTTQPQVTTGDGEIPEVYRALRDVNRTLPPARWHRALLGDPPIEWERVATAADFRTWLERRDPSGADVVRREAIAKGRHALLFYGSGHLQRRQQATNYVMTNPLAETVVSLLAGAGVKTLVVTTIGERDAVRGWPVPSLAFIRGTTLGAENVPQGSLPRVSIQNGAFVPIPRDQWVELRMEEQIDAVLYLGPASTRRLAPPPTSICADRAWVDVRLKRMALAGVPPSEAAQLKALCHIE